ncbi:hypothetical protein L484_024114 [Morus notabilis]|uniref:Uncharacterized protein n=1 Tax=Morus notabilis TaxID=981085 RepID=W9SEF5_9ROSA|nr:hypothetical protein L484_024114 [Morus notabilis]
MGRSETRYSGLGPGPNPYKPEPGPALVQDQAGPLFQARGWPEPGSRSPNGQRPKIFFCLLVSGLFFWEKEGNMPRLEMN